MNRCRVDFSALYRNMKFEQSSAWVGGIKNGKLLALAANEFDAFLTVDKNLPYQQNLAALPVAVIVLDSLSNELSALLPLVPSHKRALASLTPRTYVCVTLEA